MEEAFELISTGAWSIVPPLLALALALITKEVYSSLTIGVFVGMVIYQFTLNGVGVDQLVTAFTDVPNAMALQIADNGALLLFLALLGALTVVIATAGGSRAYAEWVSTHIKNARAAQVLTGLLGIIIFVDDYFNCLTVGAVMRPVTDRFHVSHEKLAWIIDSTAAPVCIIAPVSSWAVAVGGYLGDDGFTTFVQSIPYNFYALLTIFFVFFMLITSKNDYGPMRAAEAEAKSSEGTAAEGGKLLEKLSTMGPSEQAEADPDDHTNLESVVTEQADIEQSASTAIDEYKGLNISEKGKVYDLIVPILVLIFFSILGMMYTGGFFEGVDFATAVGENPVGGLCIGAHGGPVRCRRHVPAARSDHAERFRGEHLRGRAFHGRRHHDFGAGMEPGRLLPLHARHGRLREQLPEQPGRGAWPSCRASSSWWPASSASPWARAGAPSR